MTDYTDFLYNQIGGFWLSYSRIPGGVSRIFERGGPISLGSLKKRSSDFKMGGGSNGLMGGSST